MLYNTTIHLKEIKLFNSQSSTYGKTSQPLILSPMKHLSGHMMDHVQFKPFHKTYKIITFVMCIGMIYPNPANRKRRLYCIFAMLVSVAPISVIILIDIYKCWVRRDITNIFRHSTVVGPFLGGFFKMFLMNFYEEEWKTLMDVMNNDYALYNKLPKEHKDIAVAAVRNNVVYTQRCWVVFVIFTVMTFPLMAVALNVYNFGFTSDPVKYMVHDVALPFIEPEARFESPQFEIMFAYMVYSATLYVINFSGYDGFFGLCINHACLKMKLYCCWMEYAMRANSLREAEERVAQVIESQCALFRFVEIIQCAFNTWLGIILVATMIQICTCMYHITEGYEFDMRYFVFVVGTVVHIYLPCRYSSKLKDMSMETSTLLYCSGWEKIHFQKLRKMLPFMIARAQRPIEIIAFNIFVFDMELFVSILQTSYSMYTLLRS